MAISTYDNFVIFVKRRKIFVKFFSFTFDSPAGVYVCRFIDEKAQTVAAYKLIRLD